MGYFTECKREEEEIEVFADIFLKYAQARVPTEDRWFKNEKLYAGYINPATWPYRSRISVRKIWEYTNAEKARLFRATAAPRPPFHVMSVSADDPQRARKIQHLMLWQWETGMDFFTEWDRLILTGLIYAFAPYSMDWKKIFGYVPMRVPYETKGGMKGKITQNKKQQLYLGPGFTAEDPYAFYYDRRILRWQDLPCVFRRLVVHYDDCMELAQRGIFDMEAVKELKDANSQLITTDFSQRINDVLGYTNGLEWAEWDKNNDIELIEGWFPFENKLMIIAGSKKVMFNDEIPFLNAEHPFGCWVNFPSLWGIKGWSTPEIGEDQQHETNFRRNARLDNMNMGLNPMWLRSKTSGILDEDLTWSPNSWIDTHEMDGLQQLPVRDTWTQQSLQEEEVCDRDLERQLGLNRQGIQPMNRERVASVNIRAESMGILFGDKVQGLATTMKGILKKQHRLNRQFLRKSVMVRVLGEEIPGYLEVNPEDIFQDYDFVIEPSASYGNRATRKEEWLQWSQLMAAVPQLGAVTKWAPVAEQIAEEFDIRNPSQVVITSEEAQAQAAQMGPGGTPAGPGGGGGGGVEAGANTAQTALANLAKTMGAQR